MHPNYQYIAENVITQNYRDCNRLSDYGKFLCPQSRPYNNIITPPQLDPAPPVSLPSSHASAPLAPPKVSNGAGTNISNQSTIKISNYSLPDSTSIPSIAPNNQDNYIPRNSQNAGHCGILTSYSQSINCLSSSSFISSSSPSSSTTLSFSSSAATTATVQVSQRPSEYDSKLLVSLMEDTQIYKLVYGFLLRIDLQIISETQMYSNYFRIKSTFFNDFHDLIEQMHYGLMNDIIEMISERVNALSDSGKIHFFSGFYILCDQAIPEYKKIAMKPKLSSFRTLYNESITMFNNRRLKKQQPKARALNQENQLPQQRQTAQYSQTQQRIQHHHLQNHQSPQHQHSQSQQSPQHPQSQEYEQSQRPAQQQNQLQTQFKPNLQSKMNDFIRQHLQQQKPQHQRSQGQQSPYHQHSYGQQSPHHPQSQEYEQSQRPAQQQNQFQTQSQQNPQRKIPQHLQQQNQMSYTQQQRNIQQQTSKQQNLQQQKPNSQQQQFILQQQRPQQQHLQQIHHQIPHQQNSQQQQFIVQRDTQQQSQPQNIQQQIPQQQNQQQQMQEPKQQILQQQQSPQYQHLLRKDQQPQSVQQHQSDEHKIEKLSNQSPILSDILQKPPISEQVQQNQIHRPDVQQQCPHSVPEKRVETPQSDRFGVLSPLTPNTDSAVQDILFTFDEMLKMSELDIASILTPTQSPDIPIDAPVIPPAPQTKIKTNIIAADRTKLAKWNIKRKSWPKKRPTTTKSTATPSKQRRLSSKKPDETVRIAYTSCTPQDGRETPAIRIGLECLPAKAKKSTKILRKRKQVNAAPTKAPSLDVPVTVVDQDQDIELFPSMPSLVEENENVSIENNSNCVKNASIQSKNAEKVVRNTEDKVQNQPIKNNEPKTVATTSNTNIEHVEPEAQLPVNEQLNDTNNRTSEQGKAATGPRVKIENEIPPNRSSGLQMISNIYSLITDDEEEDDQQQPASSTTTTTVEIKSEINIKQETGNKGYSGKFTCINCQGVGKWICITCYCASYCSEKCIEEHDHSECDGRELIEC